MLDGEPLSDDEWEEILASSDGLVLLKGRWVEVDRERLGKMMERFRQAEGLRLVKQRTDVLRRWLPNAGIGANFSPHGGPERAYLGDVFQWVSSFREECMTLPWSEDYAWQIPVATPQMSEISLDLLRAGTRGKPEPRLLFYVMPHTPGNTPRMWRRMFHAALAHGMRAVDLFEVNPVWAAYTENHTSDPEMYAEIRRTLHQLGAYEDLLLRSIPVRSRQSTWPIVASNRRRISWVGA